MSSEDLRRRIADDKVLVIRQPGAPLTVERFVTLLGKVGSFVPHPLQNFAVPGLPQTILISNLYVQGQPVGVHDGGTYWHTDMSYKHDNVVFTALYSERVPRDPNASATEFVDCQAIFDELQRHWQAGEITSANLALDLQRAMARHRFGNRERLVNTSAAVQDLTDQQHAGLDRDVRHPLVVTHPVTGKQALYAAAATSVGIDGLPTAEAVGVLDALLEYTLRRAPRYIHRYRAGDIVVWDNLSTLHRGVDIAQSDDPLDCRLLYRVNVNYSHAPIHTRSGESDAIQSSDGRLV